MHLCSLRREHRPGGPRRNPPRVHITAFEREIELHRRPVGGRRDVERTATYARVSTAEQSPDLQRDALRGLAERADLAVVAAYADVAVSGRHQGRPDLAA